MASYGTLDGITAISPAIGEITDCSTPNSTQAEDWLTEGYTHINLALSNAGYVVPVLDTVDAYAILRNFNNLYGAAYALRARGMDAVTGQEESRSATYLREFFAGIKLLASQDLTVMGVPVRPAGQTMRRGIRTLQLRRVDGYSAMYGDSVSE